MNLSTEEIAKIMILGTRPCDYCAHHIEDSAIAIFSSTGARREPLLSTSLKHTKQLSHSVCTTNRTLLTRVRVEERRQRYDHISCNQ